MRRNEARFGRCSLAPGPWPHLGLIGVDGWWSRPGRHGAEKPLRHVKHASPGVRVDRGPSTFPSSNDCWPEFDLSRPEGRLPTTEALLQAIWTAPGAASAPDRSRLLRTTHPLGDLPHTMEPFSRFALTSLPPPAGPSRLPRPRTSRSTQVAPPPRHAKLPCFESRCARSIRTYRMVCDPGRAAAAGVNKSGGGAFDSHLPQNKEWPISPPACHRRKHRPCTSPKPADGTIAAAAPACIRCACRRARNNAGRVICRSAASEMRPASAGGPRRRLSPRPCCACVAGQPRRRLAPPSGGAAQLEPR